MFFKIAILLLLVNLIFSAEISCVFDPVRWTDCFYTASTLINVTFENEPFTVTSNHPEGFKFIRRIRFDAPNILKFIPTRIFDNLKYLQSIEVVAVQLSTLTTNAFTNCSMMDHITLRQNNFTEIPASFAEACFSLRHLDLNHNQIKTIHKDAFKGLSNLKDLLLNDNQISSLSQLFFFYTPKLQIFNIAKNLLTTLHPDLFATISPMDINLMQNKINPLPAIRFASVVNMRNIFFYGNGISSIDRKLFLDYIENRKNYSIYLDGNVCVNQRFSDTTKPNLMNDPELLVCFSNWDIATGHRNCRFFLSPENVYGCVLENVNMILPSIGGQHITHEGKTFTDSDVKAVYIKNSTFRKFPRQIFGKFSNIEIFSVVVNSNLKEILSVDAV
jgi:hypothetical protein